MHSSALSKRTESNLPYLPKCSTHPLPRSFFAGPTIQVAKALMGHCLWVSLGRAQFRIILTECEAYCGVGDPASHAYRGPTPRSQIMFGPPGVAYVYFVYGMYHCLNVVTEPEGQSGAVLLRGGYDVDRRVWINGPGKLCRELGLTLKHNGSDLIHSPHLRLLRMRPQPRFKIRKGPRIGISRAKKRLYRFFVSQEDMLRGLNDMLSR